MVTVQKRERCVGWLSETKSVTQNKRNYRTLFNKQPPSDKTIRDWQQCFLENGSVHVKSNVFRTPVNGLDDLKTRIGNAISAIPADMLHRTWQELEYRLDVLRATKGAHIEVY
jgi:hypothetical protein